MDLKNWKTAFPVITVVLAIVGGVLLAVQTAIMGIEVNTVPGALQGIFVFLRNMFGGGLFAVGLVWLRNCWGYIEAYAYAKATGNPQIEYDVNKFYKTAAYYTGNLTIIFNVAPTTELRAIGTAIVFFIDILGSVLGKIVSPPKG
jgi:hypothetical protein